MARARSALRRLTWRILFERSERSERSELCAGPWTRAPQGSRRAATTASVARRAPPAHPLAATAARTRKRTVDFRNGPQADCHTAIAFMHSGSRQADGIVQGWIGGG